MLIAFVLIAALLLAYANGANDNFKATATIFGSGTHSYRASLGLATVAQLAGSITSVIVAGALLKAFGGKGLVPPAVVQDPVFIASVASGAAATVLLATRLGIPISTTHALIGGLVGGALALSPAELAWSALGAKYFVPLLASPMLALVVAATIYPPLRTLRRRLGVDANTCICVDGNYEPVTVSEGGSMFFADSRVAVAVTQQQECTRVYGGSVMGVSAQRLVDLAHTWSALALGFARGLNDTPKVMALLVAAGWSGISPRISLAAVAVFMAVGGVLHSKRIANTLGHRITAMNRGQGLVANSVASTLVIGASLLGSPVSTTHVSTGAIFGIGVWSGAADWKVAGGIVLAWVATLPLGAVLAYSAAQLFGIL